MKFKRICVLFFIFFAFQNCFSEDINPLDKMHQELESVLDAETLAEIDTLENMKDMVTYHHSIGMMIRNNYGLWKKDSEIYKYLYDLGLRHPDDMSSVILDSFWCKRHGKDYNLDEEVKYFIQYWEEVERAEKAETERYKNALAYIRSKMANMDFVNVKIPVVSVPTLSSEDKVSLRVRYLSKYKDGVFALVRKNIDVFPKDVCGTLPYIIDLETNTVQPIQIPSLDVIESSILIDDTVWVYGKKDEKGKLLALKDGMESEFSLPTDESSPVLGFDSNELIAVYSKSVYKFSDSKNWTLIFSSEDEIPRSGVPPQVYNGVLYLRDEGIGENQKSLWMIDLEKATIECFYKKTGLVGTSGPRWENNFSYSIDKNGTLYVSAGEGYATKSLISVSKSDEFSVLIFENQIRHNNMISVPIFNMSAVSVGKDYALLAGKTGLFILFENILNPVVYFKNTEQAIPVNGGKNTYRWELKSVSDVLELSQEDYIFSNAFGGIFRIKNEDGSWKMTIIDEATE